MSNTNCYVHLQGKRLRRELLALVKDMPATYDKIARDTADLKPACDYYSAFVSFTLDRSVYLDKTCTYHCV